MPLHLLRRERRCRDRMQDFRLFRDMFARHMAGAFLLFFLNLDQRPGLAFLPRAPSNHVERLQPVRMEQRRAAMQPAEELPRRVVQ